MRALRGRCAFTLAAAAFFALVLFPPRAPVHAGQV